MKVKGDLILISADIDHSLSKVLPLQQSLIPVCFKRKLSYHGSYIEEYVEKDKIKLYFAWLKRHNHLYKDIELNSSLLDTFESECISSAKKFESNTRAEDVLYQSDEEEEPQSLINHEVYFEDNGVQSYELHENSEQDWTHAQTSMFLNKYCQDINIPSIANKVADMVINLKSTKRLRYQMKMILRLMTKSSQRRNS